MILDDGGDATLLVHKGYELENGSKCGLRTPSESEEEQIIKDLLKTAREAASPAHWHQVVQGIEGRHRRDHHRRQAPLPDARAKATSSSRPSTSTTRSPKSKFDNLYGCRESLVDGIKRATDVMVAGKVAVVVRLRRRGQGLAPSPSRGLGAACQVTEIDPICALQAAMEGYQVVTIEDAPRHGRHLRHRHRQQATSSPSSTCCKMKDQRDRLQHRPLRQRDRQVARLRRCKGAKMDTIKPQVDQLHLPGRPPASYMLAEGRLVNLGCATGHPAT
jgi:adenosylhomocysteinase